MRSKCKESADNSAVDEIHGSVGGRAASSLRRERLRGRDGGGEDVSDARVVQRHPVYFLNNNYLKQWPVYRLLPIMS